MKIFKNLIVSVAIVFVTLAVLVTLNHFIGEMYTNAIILILILIGTAFLFQSGFFTRREMSVKVEKVEASLDDILNYACALGGRIDMDYTNHLKPESEQPDYSQLTSYQQAMKSEESALRVRMAETIRLRDSDEFKSWEEEKRDYMLKQLGAMTLYHWSLLARCISEGVILEKGSSSSSGSSDSSSSDSSSSDSSSSDGSSSDSSSDIGSSSSSDSSDCSSSSSDDGNGGLKEAPSLP